MSRGRHTERSDDDEIDFTIVTSDEAADEYDVRIWTTDGYSRVADCQSDLEDTGPAYVHHLSALLDHGPHRVFDEGTEVHHSSLTFLDLPEYVEVVDRSEHYRLHRSETFALDSHAIPVRRDAGEVPEDERVVIEEPDDLSRFAMGPRADSPIHETDDDGTEADE